LVKDCDMENLYHHRLTLWSGQIANLIGRRTLMDSGERGETYLEELEPSLLEVAQGVKLNPVERAEAADVLDGLGYVPEDLYEFVEIPGDDDLPTFWIGKYPVTNLQYDRFLTEENIKNRQLWCGFPDYNHESQLVGNTGDDGWRWIKKELKDNDIPHPRYWKRVKFGKTRNCVPVVGISWYEAMAYAHWLQINWATLKEAENNNIVDSSNIRLPLDGEWLKAAGGADHDRYPWDKDGETSDKEKVIQAANIWESQIHMSTPVWMYPLGRSVPYKLFDMAGNVWKWQANQYGKDQGLRVLRGGSFSFDQGNARCAVRVGTDPDGGIGNVGFRLCLCP